MNSSTKNILFIIALFFSGLTFSQHKFQFGFKLNTFFKERFRLEQRFQFSSPYLLSVSYAFGRKRISGYSNTFVNSLDSTTTTTSQSHSTAYRTLKFGLQRKLPFKFLKHGNVYFGLTAGVGFQEDQKSTSITSNWLYSNETDQPAGGSSDYTMQALRTQLGTTFGLNYPLKKWLIFNAEVGMIGELSNYFDDTSASFGVHPFISTGFFFPFGRREEPNDAN